MAPRSSKRWPLYAELHAHHVQVVPELCGLPPRSQPEAWAGRRARYVRWFESADTFVVAEEDMSGYAFVVVADGYDGWGGDRIGEVKDLVVAARARRCGLGTELLEAAEARLAELGVRQYRLSVLRGNEAAAAFYAARGLVPTATTLSRRLA